jgi:hypothetical protein
LEKTVQALRLHGLSFFINLRPRLAIYTNSAYHSLSTCFFIQSMVLCWGMKSIKSKPKNTQIKPIFAIGLALMLLIPTAIVKAEFPSKTDPYPANFYAMCFDGIDNNGNGKTDMQDSNCPKCFINVDNAGNGLINSQDPACPNYVASSNPPVPRQSFFEKILGAFISNNQSGQSGGTTGANGGSIPSGGTIPSGGSISSGGTINNCTSVTVFPQKHFTTSGYYYTYFYYCNHNIPQPTDYLYQNAITSPNSPTYSKYILSGGTIPSGGTINSGGSISNGGSIPGGGTIPSGGSIPSGESIPGGGTIPSGGSI